MTFHGTCGGPSGPSLCRVSAHRSYATVATVKKEFQCTRSFNALFMQSTDLKAKFRIRMQLQALIKVNFLSLIIDL